MAQFININQIINQFLIENLPTQEHQSVVVTLLFNSVKRPATETFLPSNIITFFTTYTYCRCEYTVTNPS